MRKVVAVIGALFRSGIVGGSYGAVLGAVYAGLLCISGALRTRDPGFLTTLPVPVAYGATFGFPSGFISAVLGGGFGGPIGYGVGGFFGTGAVMFLCFGRAEGFSSAMFVIYPSIWGAAFGLVLGLHLRRRVLVLPGAKWLGEGIYSSPLGLWLGWRQRHVE